MNSPPYSAITKHCSSPPIHLRFLVGLLLLGLNLLLTAAADAQISYRSATTASTTSASSLSISKPTGTVANDVLIASIAVRPNTISISAPGSSSITRVGIGATVGEDSDSVTAELPTGIVIGDLMICLVESNDNNSHSTSTAGWTKMYELSSSNKHTASLFWKVATSSSETNPLISHSGGSSIVTQSVAYRGVNTTTPFDTTPAYAAAPSNNDNDTSLSTGTLTTVTNGVKLLFAAHIADNPSTLTITTGGGLTWSQAFLGTHNKSGDNDAAVGLLDTDKSAAGSAGPYSASYDAQSRSHGVLLALRPASSSGSNNWTLIRSDTATIGNMGTLATYYKVAGASEPNSYAFTFSGTTTGAVGSILTFSGVDTTSPIDQQNGQRTPDSVDHTAPAVTTTSSGDMLVTAHAYASSRTWTPPSGMTERVDIASTTGAGGIAMEVNTEPQATAGATGSRTATAAGDSDTGAAHLLALRPSITPIAEYHFDESAWNGTTNEITDTSGNIYSGTAASLSAIKPTTSDTSPVISGDLGTCRYGVFNRTNKDYVALPASFPNLGANGNAFTITAWIKTTDNTQSGQRIFIDDENNSGGFGISLGDGGTGRVRFYSRGTPSQLILDTTNVITNNTWYFVAAVADVPNKIKRIYVYNTAGTKLAEVSATWTETSFGSDSGIASIGGETNAAGEKTSSFGFSGSIDEVSVFGNALSQGTIESIRARTHSCGTTTVDHFVISHSGTGVNCQAEPITFTAHNATHTVVTLTAGTVIDITTSTSHGDWTLGSGGGSLANNGSGSAKYIAGAESSFTLNLKDTFPETTNINMVSSISATERTGTASEDIPFDPNIVFSSSGFSFLDAASAETIATQLGGKTSVTYYLQAIRTDTRTGTCVGAFGAGQTVNIDLAFQCNNPTISAGRQVAFTNNSITTNLAANPSTGITTYTAAIPVTFLNDSTSRAAFTINYPDVGQITLAARYNLPLANGSPSNNLMTGTSNSFVVRPFALSVTAIGNPAATGPAGAVYRIAGNDFSTNVRAVLWQAADDIDNNGIADGHDDSDPSNNANLTDNTSAPNFGKESTVETISLSAALNQPVGGVNPALAGTTTISSFASGAGSTTLRYNEVGIIELRTVIGDGDYLGIGALATAQIVGRSGYVGRFLPDHFVITPGAVTEGCNSGDFTYFGQDGFSTAFTLTAQNAANVTTQNYAGTFAKLGLTAWNNFTFTATGLPAGSTLSASATAPTGTWINGAATVIATHQATRPLAPIIPANITINAQPTDTDGVTMAAAVALHATTTPLFFGRLVLQNAYGSETEDHKMPFQTQFFNNTAQWTTNNQDSCTTLAANNFGFANYLQQLVAVEMNPGHINVGLSTLTTINGRGSLFLTRPAGGDGRYVGSVDVCADLGPDTPPVPPNIAPVCMATSANMPWLQGRWSETNYDDDPTGRVNFGIYRGNDRIINWREIIR